MEQKAFQDYYPDDSSHCYGCGKLNKDGLQIKSYWEGEESVCIHQPKSCYMVIPGMAYGGLIASLIDCHSTGTAAAAKYRAENREMDTLPPIRFLTASLHVNYLLPTPLNGPLEIRGKVREIRGRKVVIESKLIAGGQVCATGEVVAVQVPENLMEELFKK
ncbi:MAG: PaaI family thioesterase [Smithella sp.]